MRNETESTKILQDMMKKLPPLKVLTFYSSNTEFIPHPILNQPKKQFVLDKTLHQTKE